MNRLARLRTAGALLVLVIAVSVLLTSVSNAASLSILAQSGGVFAQTNGRCTDATLDVTPVGTPNAAGEYNRVTVWGDFGSCTGGNISLVENGSSTVLFSESITVEGSSVEVETSYFNAPESDDGKIVLGLNGWLIPVAWIHEPAAPSSRCFVEVNASSWVEHETARCTLHSVTIINTWGIGPSNRQIVVAFDLDGVPSWVPTGYRVRAEVDLSEWITLSPGQTWSGSTVGGDRVSGESPLPFVWWDFGNSKSGSGIVSTQIIVVS